MPFQTVALIPTVLLKALMNVSDTFKFNLRRSMLKNLIVLTVLKYGGLEALLNYKILFRTYWTSTVNGIRLVGRPNLIVTRK